MLVKQITFFCPVEFFLIWWVPAVYLARIRVGAGLALRAVLVGAHLAEVQPVALACKAR